MIDRYHLFLLGSILFLVLCVSAHADEEDPAGPTPVPIWGIDFSPDGTKLAAAAGPRGSKGILTVLDTDTWETIFRIPNPVNLTCVAFSPDGKRLAVGTNDGYVFVVDLATKSTVKRWPSGTWGVFGINWSHDGKQIVAACSNGQLTVFDARSFEPVITFDVWKADGIPNTKPGGHADRNQWDASFTSDGHILLSGGWQDTTRLWSMETGKMIASFPEVDKLTQGVKFTPDERHFLSAGIGLDCVRIRETETFRERITLPISGRDVAIHPGGGLVAASGPASVKVFAVNLDEPSPTAALRIRALVAQAGSDDEDERSLATSKLRNMGPRIEPLLHALQQENPKGFPIQLLALCEQFNKPSEVADFQNVKGDVRQVVFSPRGNKLAASTTEGEIHVWNVPDFSFDQKLEVTIP
ncbi:WD40 repeat domain-containing protein [Blastopirellula marina]|uniref:WD40 repeat domain-containing protein n=1 Tax=Blastopirellula marina TaxID=124 RepID=UPI001305052A|nr:cytochrome D1 domain-containing protein [Blastopirellula marina]